MITATRDISEHLDAAARRRSRWTRERGASLAESISATLPDARLDWDEDAGEDWARVLVDQWVVALVRIPAPLVLVLRTEESVLPDVDAEVAVIVLDDMESAVLRAAPASIRDAFAEREPSATLNASAFSAMDLWYATT